MPFVSLIVATKTTGWPLLIFPTTLVALDEGIRKGERSGGGGIGVGGIGDASSGDGALGGKRGGRGGKGSAGSRVGGGSMYVWWKEERT